MPAPQMPDLLAQIDVSAKLEALLGVGPTPDGEYYHWDQLRHRKPPDGLTVEEWWAGAKIARMNILKGIDLKESAGSPFAYGLPDAVLRLLHGIDQDAAGRIEIAEEVTNPATRDRYIINSL